MGERNTLRTQIIAQKSLKKVAKKLCKLAKNNILIYIGRAEALKRKGKQDGEARSSREN